MCFRDLGHPLPSLGKCVKMYMLWSKSPVWQSTPCLTDETDVVVCEDNEAFRNNTEQTKNGYILCTSHMLSGSQARGRAGDSRENERGFYQSFARAVRGK